MERLEDSIRTISGIGEKRAALYGRFGIQTGWDLLRHLPARYEDRTVFKKIAELTPGESACVRAVAAQTPRESRIRRGLTLFKLRVFDESGVLAITFFNSAYAARAIHQGEEYRFYGKIEEQGAGKAMVNPEFEPESAPMRISGRILPIYPLTAGLTGQMIRRSMQEALALTGQIADPLPDSLRVGRFLPLGEAYRAVHMPETMERAAEGRRRLAYDELFFLCLGLQSMRAERKKSRGVRMNLRDMEEFEKVLPFSLTEAQRRVICEAASDMTGGCAMNRLVQGDVGSGKTAVAAALIWLAAENGYQSALMAPTEVLAVQHFESLSRLLAPFSLKIRLLTGSTGKKQRTELLEDVQSGEADLLIGTHALLSGGVTFARLGLSVVDEQHRFGVAQRARLAAKGENAHLLVLSATPIPRTLSLILFGELDLSVIDELPPGRRPVLTYLVDESKRKRMYGFIRKLAEEGRQSYIVCPVIEENGQEEMRAAMVYAKELSEKIFPDLSCGLLHGKMKSAEKQKVLSAFAQGDIQVLISTTVVEVGVDVPNAAVMVIENAERYGLSTLHQLRGRVGRGSYQSYCILMSSHAGARERLSLLSRSQNGFEIAEADLAARGPGDFFGQRQHGLPALSAAAMAGGMELLKEAQADASRMLEGGASSAELAELKKAAEELFSRGPGKNAMN